MEDLVARVEKDTGACVIYDDDDPSDLVLRLVERYRTTHFRRLSSLHDMSSPATG